MDLIAPGITLQLFTTAERQLLKGVLKKRLRAFLRTLLITFSIPYIIGLGITILPNLVFLHNNLSGGEHIDYVVPTTLADWGEWFWLVTMGSFILLAIIALFNVGMFLGKIPSAIIDLRKNHKQHIVFYPDKYEVQGFGKYFIRTSIDGFSSFEVSQLTYNSLNPASLLILEIAPRTRHFLSLTNVALQPIELL